MVVSFRRSPHLRRFSLRHGGQPPGRGRRRGRNEEDEAEDAGRRQQTDADGPKCLAVADRLTAQRRGAGAVEIEVGDIGAAPGVVANGVAHNILHAIRCADRWIGFEMAAGCRKPDRKTLSRA